MEIWYNSLTILKWKTLKNSLYISSVWWRNKEGSHVFPSTNSSFYRDQFISAMTVMNEHKNTFHIILCEKINFSKKFLTIINIVIFNINKCFYAINNGNFSCHDMHIFSPNHFSIIKWKILRNSSVLFSILQH